MPVLCSARLCSLPFRSRIIQLGALFAGAEVKYAPASFQSVRDVIVRANTTFDKLATAFRAVDCYRRRSYTRLATSGDEGLLIDRWLKVGGGLKIPDAERMAAAVRHFPAQFPPFPPF